MRPVRRFLVVTLVVAILGVGATSVHAGAQPGESPDGDVLTAGDTPATALRVLLGRLLAEHSYLLMESIRATSLRAPDGPALREALDANSDELHQAIGTVYGREAGGAFGALWQQHIELLVAHAEARRDGRPADADAALASLSAFRHEFAAFLAAANPMIDGHGEADAVQLHLDQVVAFGEGDYTKAYDAEREAFRHMFTFGDHLARAIALQFPERFEGATVAWSPASNLRLGLDRLLAEHLVLSAQAMRAGLAEAPDAAAARSALGANTGELAAAIGTYYGTAAESAFKELWGRHVGAYLAYIDAFAADDDGARAAALSTLHGYHAEIAAFLSDANPGLSREAVSDMIRRHVQALISQVDATAEGDHVRAVATIRDAYGYMFEVGDALAAAIAEQFPDQFEEIKELPPTDASTSHQTRPAGLPSWAVALLVAAALMAVASHAGIRPRPVAPPRKR